MSICCLILYWHTTYCSLFRPGLSSIVTGYLPSAVLKGFIYIVPFAMFAMAKVAGCVARSKEEIKACNMVFYFLVANVFFLSVLSGSLLDIIGQFVSHPKVIPNHLARAISSQVCCFHPCCSSWHILYISCLNLMSTPPNIFGKGWSSFHLYIETQFQGLIDRNQRELCRKWEKWWLQ